MKAQIEWRPETLHDEIELNITLETGKTFYLRGAEATEMLGRIDLDTVTPSYSTEYAHFYDAVTLTADFVENWLQED